MAQFLPFFHLSNCWGSMVVCHLGATWLCHASKLLVVLGSLSLRCYGHFRRRYSVTAGFKLNRLATDSTTVNISAFLLAILTWPCTKQQCTCPVISLSPTYIHNSDLINGSINPIWSPLFPFRIIRSRNIKTLTALPRVTWIGDVFHYP